MCRSDRNQSMGDSVHRDSNALVTFIASLYQLEARASACEFPLRPQANVSSKSPDAKIANVEAFSAYFLVEIERRVRRTKALLFPILVRHFVVGQDLRSAEGGHNRPPDIAANECLATGGVRSPFYANRLEELFCFGRQVIARP